jgi:hypothetical protein
MSLRCAYCGVEGAMGHHVTGRDPQLQYLDPRLTIQLCHDHHQLVHDDLRAVGADDPVAKAPRQLPFVERVEWRLRRLAVVLGRLATAVPDWGWLGSLAASAKRWADELASDIRVRDARDPGWRSDPGYYVAAA